MLLILSFVFRGAGTDDQRIVVVCIKSLTAGESMV